MKLIAFATLLVAVFGQQRWEQPRYQASEPESNQPHEEQPSNNNEQPSGPWSAPDSETARTPGPRRTPPPAWTPPPRRQPPTSESGGRWTEPSYGATRSPKPATSSPTQTTTTPRVDKKTTTVGSREKTLAPRVGIVTGVYVPPTLPPMPTLPPRPGIFWPKQPPPTKPPPTKPPRAFQPEPKVASDEGASEETSDWKPEASIGVAAGVYVPVQPAYPRLNERPIKPWENHLGPDKPWEIEHGHEYTTLSYDEIQARNAKVVVTEGPTRIPYSNDKQLTCYSCFFCSNPSGSATATCPTGFACWKLDYDFKGFAYRGCMPGCVEMGTNWKCCFRPRCNGALKTTGLSLLTLVVASLVARFL